MACPLQRPAPFVLAKSPAKAASALKQHQATLQIAAMTPSLATVSSHCDTLCSSLPACRCASAKLAKSWACSGVCVRLVSSPGSSSHFWSRCRCRWARHVAASPLGGSQRWQRCACACSGRWRWGMTSAAMRTLCCCPCKATAIEVIAQAVLSVARTLLRPSRNRAAASSLQLHHLCPLTTSPESALTKLRYIIAVEQILLPGWHTSFS